MPSDSSTRKCARSGGGAVGSPAGASGVRPSESRFSGEAGRRIDLDGRTLEITSSLDVLSDETSFHVTIVRTLRENGEQVRRREWEETVPRDFN